MAEGMASFDGDKEAIEAYTMAWCSAPDEIDDEVFGEHEEAMEELRTELLQNVAQVAGYKVMVRNLQKRIKTMTVEIVLGQISHFGLLDTYRDIVKQGKHTDWDLIERNVDFAQAGLEIQKRMFQWYAANWYATLEPNKGTTVFTVWNDLQPALLQDWLKPNELEWRHGRVMLSDISKAIRKHKAAPGRSITFHFAKMVFEECKSFGNPEAKVVLPFDHDVWEHRFVQLQQMIEEYGEEALPKYLNYESRYRMMDKVLRDAGVDLSNAIFWTPGEATNN